MGMSGRRWLVLAATTGLLACGNESDGRTEGDENKVDPAGPDGSVGDGQVEPDGQSSSQGDGSVGDDNNCATVTMGVGLEPVHLAFGFDVSGSMGNNDETWHQRSKKWDPIVSATRAFFGSERSVGLNASLTFFPGPSRDRMCTAGVYSTPSVPMTALPSPLFSSAIESVTPKGDDDWRMGTPTVAVMQGLQTAVGKERTSKPGRYAIVLVTDGYPQLCDGQNEVRLVSAESAKALKAQLPTYVIGVANPKDEGPENVTGMHEIAKAGGTGSAFIIDTGDATATATAFTNAIAKIRTAAVSCSVAIPTSSERAFDKSRVTVHYNGQKGATTLTYDATCKASNAWHYDSVTDPKQIELCASTCDAVRADPTAQLEVGFACKSVIVF
jgi:hypothetical protein